MCKQLISSLWFIIIVQFRNIEGFVEFVDITDLPKDAPNSFDVKATLDGFKTTQPIQLLAYSKISIIGRPIHIYLDAQKDKKRAQSQLEVISNRIRRSLEDQEDLNRNAREENEDLDDNKNNGDDSVMEPIEFLQPPKANDSTSSDGVPFVDAMASSGNNSYAPPPSGNPWKPETTYYPPQPPQSFPSSYYPQQSTCVCQPVYYKPPPMPYAYYQPPDQAGDAFFEYSHGPPTQGQLFKPFPFSLQHAMYPGASYFKPSRPDLHQNSFDAPKHSFIPIFKNLFKKK